MIHEPETKDRKIMSPKLVIGKSPILKITGNTSLAVPWFEEGYKMLEKGGLRKRAVKRSKRSSGQAVRRSKSGGELTAHSH
jgi:hypothetical protein